MSNWPCFIVSKTLDFTYILNSSDYRERIKMEIPDLSKEEGLVFLNNHLKDKSFIGGFKPSKADVSVWEKLKKCPSEQYENVHRWHNQISSYGSERNTFPASDIAIKFANLQIGDEVLLF